MKKIFLGVVLLTAFTCANAQTAEEIVNKHVEARGGKAKFDQLKSVVMEGTMNAQGATLNMTFTKVVGKLNRQDISVMGMNGYDLTTDKEGWTFMPFMGHTAPVEKTGDALKEAQQQLGLFSDDILIGSGAEGNKVELQGKESISGKDCYKIKVIAKAGDSSTVYVDPESYQIARVSTVRQFNGQSIPVSIDLSDYKDVDGVKFPFTMGTPQGNVVFTSIKVNQPVAEKMYKHE